jgi:hypothetical protein
MQIISPDQYGHWMAVHPSWTPGVLEGATACFCTGPWSCGLWVACASACRRDWPSGTPTPDVQVCWRAGGASRGPPKALWQLPTGEEDGSRDCPFRTGRCKRARMPDGLVPKAVLMKGSSLYRYGGSAHVVRVADCWTSSTSEYFFKERNWHYMLYLELVKSHHQANRSRDFGLNNHVRRRACTGGGCSETWNDT